MKRYRLQHEDVDAQLMAFVIREVNFRTKYLGDTYLGISKAAKVHRSTLEKMCNGTTKHPQVRTLFSLLTTLGFNFDVIQKEVRETVVPLHIG